MNALKCNVGKNRGLLRKVGGVFAVFGGFAAGARGLVLDFEGLGITDGAPIGSAYAAQGITFGSSMLYTLDRAMGGIYHVFNIPSPVGCASTNTLINVSEVSGGFSAGTTFKYSNTGPVPVEVQAYRDNLFLGRTFLPPTPNPTSPSMVWIEGALQFTGLANRLRIFSGANFVSFDDINLSNTPGNVPQSKEIIFDHHSTAEVVNFFNFRGSLQGLQEVAYDLSMTTGKLPIKRLVFPFIAFGGGEISGDVTVRLYARSGSLSPNSDPLLVMGTHFSVISGVVSEISVDVPGNFIPGTSELWFTTQFSNIVSTSFGLLIGWRYSSNMAHDIPNIGLSPNSARIKNASGVWQAHSPYNAGLRVEAAPGVAGRITFGGLASGASIPLPELEYRLPGTNMVVFSTTAHPETTGVFVAPSPGDLGEYDLSIKHGHWLRNTLSVNTSYGTATGLEIVLINGDSDGDNEVGIGDYAIVSTAYGSQPGDGNWIENADLNHDNAVNIADYGVLSSSYGSVGDQ